MAVRIALINTSNKVATIEVTTKSQVTWYRLPSALGGPPQERTASYEPGTWTVELQPETIYGFHTNGAYQLASNPLVTVVEARDKDPWPPPPPPPPYKQLADFEGHWNRFLKPAE